MIQLLLLVFQLNTEHRFLLGLPLKSAVMQAFNRWKVLMEMLMGKKKYANKSI